MSNRKCPDCKECLDWAFSPDGRRFYFCFLCSLYFELTLSGLKEIGFNKFMDVMDGTHDV